MRNSPILTLLGRCHRPNRRDSRNDVNEAILLGPDGRELARHRKLASFTADRRLSEKLEVGQTLTVLESAAGNLVPLICLDLPNVAISALLKQTHGNVILVPSLSSTTSAHSNIALGLQASNRTNQA